MPENTIENRALERRQVQYLLGVVQDELGSLSTGQLLLVKSMLWDTIRNLSNWRLSREIMSGERPDEDWPDYFRFVVHHEWLTQIQDKLSDV